MQMNEGGVNMTYINLKAEMSRKSITIETLSKLLGIHRNSVSNKINGSSSFSIEEAIKIKNRFFPEMSYKYLFETEEPERKSS